MAEDAGLCSHFGYHKQKIFLFLAAMRSWASDRRKDEFEITYHALDDRKNFEKPFEEKLKNCIEAKKAKKLICFEIEDKFFEARIQKLCLSLAVELEIRPSPMFLTTRLEFQDYLKTKPKPFMKTFYEHQRQRLGVLLDKAGKPVGGKYSFDDENRKPLPKVIAIPSIPRFGVRREDEVLARTITERFPKNPGTLEDFWLPTREKDAVKWLDVFLEERFANFGVYEDALKANELVLFHSALAPLMNLGILTPGYIIERALDFAKTHKTPLNSVEGFVRQIIGWREFIRGIYQNFSDRLESSNHWGAQRKLGPAFYDATTGIEVLDVLIKKVMKHAYAHHIERLMVFANIMNLLEVKPVLVYKWFMELFCDSSDWVMVPNVYGMGLVSCGGLFATKPYICGSNYWIKMGLGPKTKSLEGVDALYWSFIDRHRSFFLKNPRMAVMPRSFDKMDKAKRQRLLGLAGELKDQLCPL